MLGLKVPVLHINENLSHIDTFQGKHLTLLLWMTLIAYHCIFRKYFSDRIKTLQWYEFPILTTFFSTSGIAKLVFSIVSLLV